MTKNIYKAKVNFIGHYTEYDEGAPISWVGSHIYDADYPAWFSTVMYICADSFCTAESFAEQYNTENDHLNPNTLFVEEVDITSIEQLGSTKDDYDYGVIDIEYGKLDDNKYIHKKYEEQ